MLGGWQNRSARGKPPQDNLHDEQTKLRIWSSSSFLRGRTKDPLLAPISSSSNLTLHSWSSGTILYVITFFTLRLVRSSIGMTQSLDIFFRFLPYGVLRSDVESPVRKLLVKLFVKPPLKLNTKPIMKLIVKLYSELNMKPKVKLNVKLDLKMSLKLSVMLSMNLNMKLTVTLDMTCI